MSTGWTISFIVYGQLLKYHRKTQEAVQCVLFISTLHYRPPIILFSPKNTLNETDFRRYSSPGKCEFGMTPK